MRQIILLLLLLSSSLTIIIIIIIIIITDRSYTNFLPIKRVITNDQRFMFLISISNVFKSLYFPILLHSFSPVQVLQEFPCPYLFTHLPFFSLSNHPNPVSTNLIRNLKPSLIYKLSLAVLFFVVMQCL